MKPPEQEAKEIVTTMLKKMACCIEDLPNHIENGIAREVSLSAVDKIIAILHNEEQLTYWKEVKDFIKRM